MLISGLKTIHCTNCCKWKWTSGKVS